MSATHAVSTTGRLSLAQRAERLEAVLDANPRRVFVWCTTLFFLVTALLAAAKVYWFDELITIYIVRAHSFRAIWRALAAGVDQNPPLHHALTLVLHAISGGDEVATRVPAMVAFWIAAFATFLFVRHRLPTTFAAGAALFPLATRAFDYSFDARPYGLLMASGMLALLAWQHAAEHRLRTTALVTLTVALAAGVSSHYYAVLVFLPIAAGELVRTLRRGRIDLGVWVAQSLGALPLLAYLPLIRTDIRLYTPYAWNHPRLAFLWSSYDVLLEETIWPAIVLLASAIVVWSMQRKDDDELLVPAHELAAIITLVALPVAAYVLAVMKTGQVSARYVLPATFGIAIALAVSIAKLARRSAAAGFLFVLVALCWFGVRTTLMASELGERREQFNSLLQKSELGGTLPILSADSQAILPLAYYADQKLADRLTFAIDFDAVHQFQKEDSAEQTLFAGRDLVFPIHEQALADFRSAHHDYLVLDNEHGWLMQKLRSSGVKLRPAAPNEEFYSGQIDPLFRLNPQLWMAEELAPANK